MNLKTIFTPLLKPLAVVLVLAVLFPSAIKLTHVFSHRSHKVCKVDGNKKTHFHESDLNCDFYKFQLNNTQFFVSSNYDLLEEAITEKTYFSHYISFEDYQHLSRFDRGPPVVI
ncbi:MAG: hypothetical protein ABJQ39_03380 [Winogradskyella arenosi]